MRRLEAEPALTLIRVVTGVLVAPHGVRKLVTGPVAAIGKRLSELGFPEWFAWVVALGELCGFALAVGLFTRLAGAAVALTMAGIFVFVNAANLAHLGTGKSAGAELSLLMAVIAAVFALLPAGRYSLDSFLKTRT